jgi:hypothetical protein
MTGSRIEVGGKNIIECLLVEMEREERGLRHRKVIQLFEWFEK